MRWAMSSTASAGMAVMYLTWRPGWAGALSVRNVCVQSAAPEPSSTVSLSRYCMLEASVPLTSTVRSLVPTPVGVNPIAAPLDVFTSSTAVIVCPGQLAVYSGLYRSVPVSAVQTGTVASAEPAGAAARIANASRGTRRRNILHALSELRPVPFITHATTGSDPNVARAGKLGSDPNFQAEVSPER